MNKILLTILFTLIIFPALGGSALAVSEEFLREQDIRNQEFAKQFADQMETLADEHPYLRNMGWPEPNPTRLLLRIITISLLYLEAIPLIIIAVGIYKKIKAKKDPNKLLRAKKIITYGGIAFVVILLIALKLVWYTNRFIPKWLE